MEDGADIVFRRNVTLSEQALIGMVTASVETYKKETFGCLLGSVHKKHYMVVDALPVQMAERDYDFVDVKEKDVRRINYVLSHLSGHRMVGDFHSHPDFPEHLSKYDKKAFRESGTPLSIVVLVRKTRKKTKWQANEDLSISGSIGKKYFVKVMAYEYDQKLDRIFRIKIVCKILDKINKIRPRRAKS